MGIVETKEVTQVKLEKVLVGRKCDICGRNIDVSRSDNTSYNYFVIHTWHYDWGNDSIDSHEYLDACCPECVMKFTKDYIERSYERIYNTKRIEITHVRSLEAGAHDE